MGVSPLFLYMQEDQQTQIYKQVEEISESLVVSEGMELVDLEYRREGPRWMLRLFIDKGGGVTVDDCARISRELGDLLDVKDLIPQAYVLEVSSPGLNRRIRKKKDFSRFAGQKVQLLLVSPKDGRRKIVGDLVGVEGEEVVVIGTEGRFSVALENIARANLIYEF
ncbi:MAG: ribosome maturation factor RimP [Deltaproteobacteria bacterium]|nr:ribosome maturation factor RimP [Deltaproteobacteria bacterium]